MSHNPYNVIGISDEDRAMIQYMKDADFPGHPTSTTDHALRTSSGNISNHRKPGTNGEGLAIDAVCDARMKNGYPDPDGLSALFYLYAQVETELRELICAWAPYNIRYGQRVARYAVDSHRDHIHVAVNKGTFTKYPRPKKEGVIVPSAKDQMASCSCWWEGCPGYFVVEYDGGVLSGGNHSGDHFTGSYWSDKLKDHRNDPNRRFWGIETAQGVGYYILGTDGSSYLLSR